VSGKWLCNNQQYPLIITAQADRIDILKNNTVCIVDYKSKLKKNISVLNKHKLQLYLESFILQKGSFIKINPSNVTNAQLWYLDTDNNKFNTISLKGLALKRGIMNHKNNILNFIKKNQK
jgi:RecB family exonuclease